MPGIFFDLITQSVAAFFAAPVDLANSFDFHRTRLSGRDRLMNLEQLDELGVRLRKSLLDL